MSVISIPAVLTCSVLCFFILPPAVSCDVMISSNNGCLGKLDGFYAFDENLNKSQDYYMCISGTQYNMSCEDFYIFDSTVGDCLRADGTTDKNEGSSPSTENPFDCSEDGSFSLGECNQEYFICFNGQLYPRICDDFEIFDENTDSCVPIESVPECNKPFECEADGFYPMAPCSNTYYTCIAGELFIQKCPGDSVFYQGICTSPSNDPACSATTSHFSK